MKIQILTNSSPTRKQESGKSTLVDSKKEETNLLQYFSKFSTDKKTVRIHQGGGNFSFRRSVTPAVGATGNKIEKNARSSKMKKLEPPKKKEFEMVKTQ